MTENQGSVQGLQEQHARDSRELRRLCAERDYYRQKAVTACSQRATAIIALRATRDFIAAERRTLVECSVTPKTHTLEPDDYAEAQRITDLLKLIDNALGQHP